jgi:hypothetical protein
MMYKDLRRTDNTMAIRQRTNNDVQIFVHHCLSFVLWPLYCLSFLDLCTSLFVLCLMAIVLPVLLRSLYINKDLRRTDNTMAIRQRTNNDVQRSKKDRQYNGHNLYIIVCPLSYGHCIVCPS